MTKTNKKPQVKIDDNWENSFNDMIKSAEKVINNAKEINKLQGDK